MKPHDPSQDEVEPAEGVPFSGEDLNGWEMVEGGQIEYPDLDENPQDKKSKKKKEEPMD